ncbi:hypothetical protein DPMN_139402 [Dreissena polymorpha]|uniref:Uncharacterized protein n=1 Tax=Dreissena polymorpha TaxID=45954 RepID=A0A9D4G685_DREPO|nr:hypothetical protein DPMN_139402 [Dreissena polymorpha]
MSDGGSGWGSVRLLGRPWTDLLSREARGRMRERLFRWLRQLEARGGAVCAGEWGLTRPAWIRLRGSGGLCTPGTVKRSNCLLRLTDANNLTNPSTSDQAYTHHPHTIYSTSGTLGFETKRNCN